MKEQPELKVHEVDVASLVPYANNANIHTNLQIEQLANSIEEFGFCDPVGVWENANGEPEIVEGHGRVLAAKKLGLDKIPVIYLNGLSDSQRRAYTHVHNQLTRNSEFDLNMIAREMAELTEFDWEALGFEDEEENEEPEPVKPEYEFANTLDEENNYIVLKFTTDVDWINAQSLFGLKTVKRLSTRKDGYLSDKMTVLGLGRVIDGAEAINKLMVGGGFTVKISVCAPSYRRPKVDTLKVYPSTRIYVDVKEANEYAEANPWAIIVPVESKYQGNLCRIRNHILDREFSDGVDAVLIIDDDMDGIYRHQRKGDFGYEKKKLTEDELLEFVETGSILCDEWGYKMWGVNCVMDPKAYRQMAPFNTTKYIGGPFQCHLNNPLRYDENLPLKEDYDITLQHFMKYRGALRFNMYYYICKQAEQTGGCAQYRNIQKEKDQFLMLQKKWGSDVITRDRSSKRQFDFNPILRSPLRGV